MPVCMSAPFHLSSHISASASINLLPAQQPANQPVWACCYGNGCLGDISFVFNTSFSSSLFLSLPHSHSFVLFLLLYYVFAHLCLSASLLRLSLTLSFSFFLSSFGSISSNDRWRACFNAPKPSYYAFKNKQTKKKQSSEILHVKNQRLYCLNYFILSILLI